MDSRSKSLSVMMRGLYSSTCAIMFSKLRRCFCEHFTTRGVFCWYTFTSIARSIAHSFFAYMLSANQVGTRRLEFQMITEFSMVSGMLTPITE